MPGASAERPALAADLDDLVAYMLFSGEAPAARADRGRVDVRARLCRRGPRDAAGRSLRDFDLRDAPVPLSAQLPDRQPRVRRAARRRCATEVLRRPARTALARQSRAPGGRRCIDGRAGVRSSRDRGAGTAAFWRRARSAARADTAVTRPARCHRGSHREVLSGVLSRCPFVRSPPLALLARAALVAAGRRRRAPRSCERIPVEIVADRRERRRARRQHGARRAAGHAARGLPRPVEQAARPVADPDRAGARQPPTGVTRRRDRLPDGDRLPAGRPARAARWSSTRQFTDRRAAGDCRRRSRPAPTTVPFALRYQACDDKVCFAPATATGQWTLRRRAGDGAAVTAQHADVLDADRVRHRRDAAPRPTPASAPAAAGAPPTPGDAGAAGAARALRRRRHHRRLPGHRRLPDLHPQRRSRA